MTFEFCNSLQKYQPRGIMQYVPRIDPRDHPLYPLIEGKPVILRPYAKGEIHLKKRKKQTVYPTVWMAPVSLFGLESGSIMISIPVYGSAVINPKSVTSIDLWQLGGMSMHSCKVLAWHLRWVFSKNTCTNR